MTIVPLNMIELDEHNHRYPTTSSQREALQTILNDQKIKLVNLARDIIEHGLNPSELVIIISHPDYQDKYVVVEGNRRVAALKILENPRLLNEIQVDTNIVNAFERASPNLISRFDTPVELNACLVANRNVADTWIERKHGNEMDGVGTVKWSTHQKRQFESKRGAPAIEQQVIEFLLAKELLNKDDAAEIHMSTLSRIVGDPDVRRHIGLDREKGQLYKKYPDKEVSKGLMRIVNDLLGNNIGIGRKLDTDDVRRKSDRERYIRNFTTDDLPNLDTRLQQKHPLEFDSQSGESASDNEKSNESAQESGGSVGGGGTARASHSRRRLIPHNQQLKIGNQTPRLKTVFAELKKIDIDQFTNAAGVLLRVFIEISCDKYGTDNGLMGKSLRSNDPSSPNFGFRERARLHNKMSVVANHLNLKEKLNPKELQAIKTVLSDKDNPFLTVDLLHSYAHSGAYNPNPRELKDFWDNLQIMLVAIWS